MKRHAYAWSALIVAGFFSISSATAADVLRVRLDWTPWGTHAPFHLAQQRGLFEANDLVVELVDGNGSVATVQIVGNGEYDLGHASLASMAIGRDQGLPVKAIAAFFRQNDIGLLVDADSEVSGPQDLAGMRLAFTAGSLEAPFLDRFFEAGGLTRDDVTLINVSAAAKGGTYLAEQADGAFSSAPFLEAVVGDARPSKSIRFADYGLDFPSFGLFATEAAIEEKGEILTRFASVVAGTWAYILDGNEDEAVQAILEARPQAGLSPQVLRAQIETLRGYIHTPATQDQPMGVMTLEDWQRAVEVLAEGELVSADADASDFFIDDLIDLELIDEVTHAAR